MEFYEKNNKYCNCTHSCNLDIFFLFRVQRNKAVKSVYLLTCSANLIPSKDREELFPSPLGEGQREGHITEQNIFCYSETSFCRTLYLFFFQHDYCF